MASDLEDSRRENPLPQHGLLFLISSKGSFICTIPQTGYLIICYTCREAQAGMENNIMGSPLAIDPTTHHTMGLGFGSFMMQWVGLTGEEYIVTQ